MVTKILKKGLLLITALSALFSCDKPFSLDLPLAVDSHEYIFPLEAGEARIFFYTTKAWNISLEPADCSWASVSRTSGDGTEDVEEIIFTYESNQFQDREVALVITAGSLQERITMSQTGTSRESWDGSFGIDGLNTVKPQ